MPHGAEQPLDEQDEGSGKSKPELRVVQGEKDADFYLPDEPDLSEEALARAQGLEPVPVLPEHNEATPESLINAPYLRAARDQLVSAWADLRKYEHGLIGAARGIVARKSKDTAQARYDATLHAYQQALRQRAQEVEREFGTIEKAKALVSAMEQMTDARAEVVIGKNEISRKLYQLWQKMGELNVGNIDAVKNILARQEDDGAWKGRAKAVGRFIARGMSLRSAVGAAMVGSGFWFAYAGWRVASGAATGVGVHMLAREGMRVGSRELLKGSESKVRREYGEAELESMGDKELGELMQAYGARLGFHGEKLRGNARFERVRDAFLSRFELVEEDVKGRIDVGWDEEPRSEDDGRALEAMMTKRDRMMERLNGLAGAVEDELAKQEKQDRKQRLGAAALALAAGGAMMYWRGGVSSAAPEAPATVEAAAPVTPEPALFAEAPVVAPPAETPAIVEPEAKAEAAPAGVELPHGVADVYEIKSGQGLLHAANEFQKAQHDEIIAGIKTQHPEWFAKGEDFAIRKWRLEQVRAHGGDITAAGEKYTETLHTGAKIQLEFDDKGYPHLTAIEDKNITHHAEQLRPRVETVHETVPHAEPGEPIEYRFNVDGVRGKVTLHIDPETGSHVIDMPPAMVDKAVVGKFLAPDWEKSLKELWGGDEASLAVAREQAQDLAGDIAARRTLLHDLILREQGDLPLAHALEKDLAKMEDIAHRWYPDKSIIVEREAVPLASTSVEHAAAGVSLKESDAASMQAIIDDEAAYVKGLDEPNIIEIIKKQAELDPATVNPAELKFPLDWTSAQQDAARRVMAYYQEIVRTLEKQLNAYGTEHAGDPLLEKLRDKFNAAKADALTDGEYSVRDMLKRMYENRPGKIPVVELVPGTSTVVGSARKEAEGIFDEWVS